MPFDSIERTHSLAWEKWDYFKLCGTSVWMCGTWIFSLFVFLATFAMIWFYYCSGVFLLPIIMLSELRIRMCLMPIWLFHFLYFTLSLSLCVSVSVNSQWGFLHNLCSFRFYWKWNDYGCVGFFCRQTKNTRCSNFGMLWMNSICLYVNVNLLKFLVFSPLDDGFNVR